MARIDKYEPKGGGFRAPLAADMTEGQVDVAVGVGLDASGHVVVGDGTTGIVGVMCMPRLLKAGDIADVMTNGEIVDVDALVPGSVINATAAGVLGVAAGTKVGFVVGDYRGPRLVIRAVGA